MAYNTKQKGFTIVELMIAIAVFSVVMLVVTVGIITVARNYQQAALRVKIEDASRELHAQLGQAIQYAGADVQNLSTQISGYNVICVGSQQFLWKPALNTNITAGEVALYVQDIAGPNNCDKPLNVATARAPLPSLARVVNFSVEPANPSTIVTRFIIGEQDMFEGDDYNNQCISSIAGGQFCAVVELNSTAARKAIKL